MFLLKVLTHTYSLKSFENPTLFGLISQKGATLVPKLTVYLHHRADNVLQIKILKRWAAKDQNIPLGRRPKCGLFPLVRIYYYMFQVSL